MAITADFTSVESGSNLFGSLRIPVHHTGIYAHCCNLGLTSVRGHIPDGDPQAISEPDLLTTGPVVYSAADLRLIMCTLSTFWAEPSRIPDFSRYQVKANYRVCTWFSAPYHETDQQIAQRFQSSINKLRTQSGVEADGVMPADIDPDALFDIAVKLSGRLVSTTLNGHQRLAAGLAALGSGLVGKLADVPEGIAGYYQGMLRDNGEQRNTDKLRHEYSQVIETPFACYDVLLTPISPMLAFAHIQQPVRERKLIVNGEPQDYNEYLFWNMLVATFGLPVTVYPLAKTMDELSCGTQTISGHSHDDMAINFVEFRESISGGFTVPEGYQRRISVTAPIKVRCT